MTRRRKQQPITIDTTAPTIQITGPQAGTAQSKTVTAAFTETNEDTNGYRYTQTQTNTCDATVIADNTQGTAYTQTLTFTAETDNNTFVCLRAQDLAGNITYSTSAEITGIDTTGAMLSSQSITTDNTNTNYAKEGDTITLTFTVSETLQTTPTVTIAGHTATVTNTDNTYTATYEVENGDDAQNITYDIGTLTDTNANTHDPAQETTAITIDTTVPTIQITGPQAGTAQSKTVTAAFTETNEDTNGYRYAQTQTSTCDATVIADNTQGTAYTQTLTFTAETDNNTFVCLRAQDLAGNTVFGVSGEITGIDATVPTLTNPSSIGSTSDTTPEFTFTSSEVGTIAYGGDCTSSDTAATSGANTVTFTTLIEGTYSNCTLTVTDSAGNTSDALAVPTFTVDTTGAMISSQSITSDNADTNYAKEGDTLTLTFTVSEALQGTPTVTIAGQTATVTNTDNTYTAVYEVTNSTPEGFVTYDIGELTDTNANTHDPSQETTAITIDTTAPTIQITGPQAGTAQSKTVTAAFTETNEDTNGYRYTQTQTSTCDATVIADNTQGTAYTQTLTFTAETDNNTFVCLRAQDLAGNITYSTSAEITGIDTTGAMLSSQSITTDNTNTNYAKEGDTITLTFTVSETLQTTPTVTIAGHTATVTNTDNTYTATYEVENGDDAQNITYDIGTLTDTNANTHDPSQETTTITIDTTAPTIQITGPQAGTAQSKTVTAAFTETNEDTNGYRYTQTQTSTCDATVIADNTQGTAYTQTLTFTAETDNNTFVCLRAEDLAGNITYSTSAEITGIDTTGAMLSSQSITTDNTNTNYAKEGDTLTLTFTVSETLQTTPTVTIAGHTATVTNTDNDYTATYEVQDGDDAENITYDIGELTDTNANTHDPPQETTAITIDTSAPTLTNPSSIGTTNDTTPEFTFTSSEVGTITYTGDCTSSDTTAATDANVVTLTTLIEGTYSNCTLTVTDTAGNTSDALAVPEFTIDTTIPTLTNPSSIGTTNDTTPEFTFTSSEEGTISYGGGCTSSDTTAATGANTVTLDALTEGTYSNCTVIVTDTAGNISNTLAVPEFTIDTTGAMLSSQSITTDNADSNYAKEGDTITLTFTTSEVLQGAPTVTIAGQTATVTNTGNDYTAVYEVLSSTPEGIITYDIGELTDTNTNTHDPPQETTTITIDTSAPTLSDPSSIGTTNDSTPEFTFTSSEEGTITYGGDCTSSDTATTSGANIITFAALSDGAHSGCTVIVTDPAGNISNTLAVPEFTIDSTIPTLTNPSSIGTTGNNTPEFTFTSSEEGTITYGGDCASSDTIAATGANTVTFAVLTEGTYSGCTVTVTDNENNASDPLIVPDFTIISIDRTAPVLSDPSNIGTTDDSTPEFTFTSDEAGVIAYTGDCDSTDTAAIDGENTITLNALSDGTYDACDVTVTDSGE